jgi:hypothetical protein
VQHSSWSRSQTAHQLQLLGQATWSVRLVLHSLAAQTLGTALCVPVLVFNRQMLHINVNHSAYCEPLGRTSSGPPGCLSACERSLDSQQRTTQVVPTGYLASVNSRYEHLCSQQILVCHVAHHSGHHRPASHVDIPQRALSSRARCRPSGNRVAVDIFVHTAPADSIVRASILDLSVTASHHLTTRPLV